MTTLEKHACIHGCRRLPIDVSARRGRSATRGFEAIIARGTRRGATLIALIAGAIVFVFQVVLVEVVGRSW